MSAPWRITVRCKQQRQFPFDHLLSLDGECGCGWVCRSLDAAVRLVDTLEFHANHPEFPVPQGLSEHVAHARAVGVGGDQ